MPATVPMLAPTYSTSQISNFFVAFITPVILSRSSSGIYFLFGGALILTVVVSTVWMPETGGRDLEAIGEAFGLQGSVNMPAIRKLRMLASWIGRVVGNSGESRGQGIEVENRGFELQSQ